MPILLPGRTADETTAEETPLRGAAGVAVDLFLIATLAALVGGVVVLAQRWNAPIRTATPIDLDPRALPGYTLLSLSRGFAAYLLSLVFTLVYGTVAAHSKRAEKVMIPLLDIGQGIPVLGFLPGLVLGMVALFPHSNVGLELACVLMIFTGQVWNMVFSFYGSVRSVPAELREVARIHRFGWFKTFRTVEVSSSAIGLVWNSMMSMAGGWFFLTVNEAFTLGNHDFRLPGVGLVHGRRDREGRPPRDALGDRRHVGDDPRGRSASLEAARGVVGALPARRVVVGREAAVVGARSPAALALDAPPAPVRRRPGGAGGGRALREAAPKPAPPPAPADRAGERLRRALLWLMGAAALGSAAWGSFRLVHLLIAGPSRGLGHPRRRPGRDVSPHGGGSGRRRSSGPFPREFSSADRRSGRGVSSPSFSSSPRFRRP